MKERRKSEEVTNKVNFERGSRWPCQRAQKGTEGHKRKKEANWMNQRELRYSKTERKLKEVQLGFRTYHSEITDLRNG